MAKESRSKMHDAESLAPIQVLSCLKQAGNVQPISCFAEPERVNYHTVEITQLQTSLATPISLLTADLSRSTCRLQVLLLLAESIGVAARRHKT